MESIKNKALNNITLLLLLICGGFSVFLLAHENEYLSLLPFIVPVAAIFAKLLWAAPVALIILFFSSLQFVGGTSSSLNLFYAVALSAVPLALFSKWMSGRRRALNRVHWWLLLLIGVMFVVMAVRGFGIRALGSTTIGGFAYIEILIVAAMVFLFKDTSMPVRRWRWALLGMCFMTALPYLAQLITLSGLLPIGDLAEGLWGLDLGRKAGNIVRYRQGGVFGLFLFLAILLVTPIRRFTGGKLLKLLLGFTVSLLIAGSSGGRGAVILLIMLAGWTAILHERVRPRHILISALAGVLVLVAMTALINYLPLAIQRSLAWIPFVEISSAAEQAASATSNWRLYIWGMAITYELPEYWLIGKGLAFLPNESVGFAISDYYEWAIRTRNYHNGPLSILIVFGAPGLFAFLGFIYASFRRHYRITRKNWESFYLSHFHKVLLSFFITRVLFFLFIFGDAHKSIPRMFFVVAILEGLVASDSYLRQESPVRRGSLLPKPKTA